MRRFTFSDERPELVVLRGALTDSRVRDELRIIIGSQIERVALEYCLRESGMLDTLIAMCMNEFDAALDQYFDRHGEVAREPKEGYMFSTFFLVRIRRLLSAATAGPHATIRADG